VENAALANINSADVKLDEIKMRFYKILFISDIIGE
jgi:hypothetical protein